VVVLNGELGCTPGRVGRGGRRVEVEGGDKLARLLLAGHGEHREGGRDRLGNAAVRGGG
jgi:hypothetical protein